MDSQINPNKDATDLDVSSDVARCDASNDGMNEYAAYYTEPPPSSTEMEHSGLININSPQGQSDQTADSSMRRDLTEPDGTSGSTSSNPVPGGKLSTEHDEWRSPRHEHPTREEHSKSGKDEKVTPTKQEIQRDNRSSDRAKSSDPGIPVIPSTNIAVAFLVTLCFNLPLGALAIYFSLMATKAYRDGKQKQGAKKARISIYISLFSIVVTVLIVMAVVLMQAMKGQVSERRYATKTSISL